MIKPLHDMVAVKVEEDKYEGSIQVVGSVDGDAPKKGKVVAVGPGKINEKGERDELQIAVDDVVVFGHNAGTVYAEEGVTLMHEAEIIAVIE